MNFFRDLIKSIKEETKSTRLKISDTYFELVKLFSLGTIESEKDHKITLSVVEKIMNFLISEKNPDEMKVTRKSGVDDRPIYLSNFENQNLDKEVKNAGLRPMRIHNARHTYASPFVINGGMLYDLKTVLSHADIKTTERYAHLSNEHLSGVRDIINPSI